MITQRTAADIALAYREIETAEKLLEVAVVDVDVEPQSLPEPPP